MGLFSKRKDEINYVEVNKALDLSKTVAAIEEKVAKERKESLHSEKEEEEWIWVEGYKGLNADMTANHGDEVFEIGKVFNMPEDTEIKTGKVGYHFSLSLGGALEYRTLCTRWFLVRGYVRKSELKKYGEYYRPNEYFPMQMLNKVAAKSIEFIKELDFNYIIETYPEIKNQYHCFFIDTAEDYQYYLEKFPNMKSYEPREWIKERFLQRLEKTPLSPILCQVFVDSFFTEYEARRSKSNNSLNTDKMLIFIKYVEGIFDTEGMSKDMQIYLITKKFDTM